MFKNMIREEYTMILNEMYTLNNGVKIPKLGLGTWSGFKQ